MNTPPAPDRATSRDRLLPCGRDPLDVADRARAGQSDPHELDCPHCRATIDIDGLGATAATGLATVEGEHPVPSTLLPAVMRSVWSDLRRAAMIPLTTDHGGAFIADHAVAAVIENALDQLPALRIHTCTARLAVTEGEDPHAATGTLAVKVTAAAAYNSAIGTVAEQARELTRFTVAQQFGWTAEPIDIAIVDVYVPEGRQQ